MSLTASKLALLNSFRQQDGLAPYQQWKGKYQPTLDAYNEKAEQEAQARADAEYAARKEAADKLKAEREAEEAALIEAANKPSTQSTTINRPARVSKSKAKPEARPVPEKVTLSLSQIVSQGRDFANHTELQEAAKELAKSTGYKQMSRHEKSAVDKPVGFVHQFLSDNPGMKRKDAILALVEGYGVNYSTARTQYQRWYAARKQG